jgi:rhamnulokinase
MGVETSQPAIDPRSLAFNITNEGGVGGTFRLLKNIMGLWLAQECRRAWADRGEGHSYDDLMHLAEQAPAFVSLIDANDPRWLSPGAMPGRIQTYCRVSRQPVPETKGAIIRCVLESLALDYRWVADRLEGVTGSALRVIHIIGGGSSNALLNQFTADATGRLVLAGPTEATALGNVLVQAITSGQLASLAEGRALVRRSFPMDEYMPRPSEQWAAAYERYLRLKG